jgi:hypothetical protein
MNPHRCTIGTAWQAALGLICFLIVIFGAAPGYAQGYPRYTVENRPLTPQEEWVLDQVKAGEVADLVEKYGVREVLANQYGLVKGEKEGLTDLRERAEPARWKSFWADRGPGLVIRAAFLRQLMADGFDGFRVHDHGVRLQNAVISGPFDLRAAVVPHDVMLKYCIFEAPIIFRDSHFKKNLQMLNSIIEKDASFLGLKVDQCAYFNESRFLDEVNFERAHIGEEFSFRGTKCLCATKKILFKSMYVGKDAHLESAELHGPVDFCLAKIDGEFEMNKVHFWRETLFDSLKVAYTLRCNKTIFEDHATFLIMKVGSYADFKETCFHGRALFGGADIGKDLRASNSQFLSFCSDHYASFFGTKVGQEAQFEGAVFNGPVDFGSADIGLNLRAKGAHFNNEVRSIETPDLKVGNTAHFEGATFKGRVSFAGAKIGGQFNAYEARFDSDQDVDFSGLKVGELAIFRNARFNGNLNFIGAKIGGELRTESIQGAEFKGGRLPKQISLNNGKFFDLSINGLKIETQESTGPEIKAPNDTLPEITKLDLTGTVVERNLTLKNFKIKNFQGNNLEVKGCAALNNLEIAPEIDDKIVKSDKRDEFEVDLRNSKFVGLDMKQTKWLQKNKDSVNLAGMSYQSIKMDKSNHVPWLYRLRNWFCSRDPLLDWLDRSKFDSRNYLQLKNHFEQTAEADLAAQAYINMKRRANGLEEWLDYFNPLQWPELLFWDLPVGRGRRPLRIFLVAIPFILAGALLFKSKDLVDREWPKKNRFYGMVGSVLLSVDIFTPSLLNLGMENHWKPATLSGGRRVYIHVHRLVGRIFIAVFFLGIWSQFK